MKNVYVIFFVLEMVSFSAFSSIDNLYLKSLSDSKQVEIYELTEKAALSSFKERKSSLFPKVDIVSANSYGNNAINAFSDRNEIDTQLSLSLEQKLFQGGAEFALNDYNKIIPKQAKAFKKKSLSEYYNRFSTLYFQVSSAMEENDKIESLLSNLTKRVAIVKKRTKIGRDRKADLYALESQLYRLEAELSASKALLKTLRTDFLNYSGLTSIDGIKDKINPLNLELSKEVNLEKRPELESLKYDHESSILEAKIEKSSYYPQIDLGANYYLDKSVFGRNDWDVSLNIRFNLLDFGQRSSGVETKRVQATINKARLDYSRMNATRKWSNFIDNFESKKREFISLKAALKRSRASYGEQLKDLKKGLVTQIEVIRSLDDVISLEKLAIKSAFEVKSLFYQAKAYLGKYPKG